MIPKIIHYCWFGGYPKNELALHCIASWEKLHPEFRIWEWNETNAPLQDNAYVKDAFSQGKWAFVSDYVRSKVMFEHGGFYMDTDMEMKHRLDEFLSEKAICGFEVSGVPYSAFWGSEPGHELAKDFLDYYDRQKGFEEKINTEIFSNLLVEKYGADRFSDKVQDLKYGVRLFPSVYFSQDLPTNYVSHHFCGSWFGGDPGNTHKNMVNVYGLMDRLIHYPGANKAVSEIFNNKKIIDASALLDLIPLEIIRKYLDEKMAGTPVN